MSLPPEELHRLRELASAFLDVATSGVAGRSEADPIYQAITEGRDVGAQQRTYSSCGDLCHWLLYRLGVRLPIVNRAEGAGWVTAKNVSRLAWAPQARAPRTGEVYQLGDILTVWDHPKGTDAHVLVVREHVAGHVHSADYGQPGGARRMRPLLKGLLGGRRLQRVLPLSEVLAAASAAGALVPPQDVADWLALIGHRPPRPPEANA
jgi:hypothetical protein